MSSASPEPIPREDGRAYDELRAVHFEKDFAPGALGSVLVSMGRTRVICGVTIEPKVPAWMRQQKISGGWITAEYSLLPYATGERTRRESTAGKVGGRTQEIQRLIGRSLRAVVDLERLGERTIWVDCDVVEADGGTRTAAVTGGFAALRLAVDRLLEKKLLESDPIQDAVAAVSVGVVGGDALLDLNYTEDVRADVDMNVVMTGSGDFVEVQGTAEAAPFSQATLDALLALSRKGIGELIAAQRQIET